MNFCGRPCALKSRTVRARRASGMASHARANGRGHRVEVERIVGVLLDVRDLELRDRCHFGLASARSNSLRDDPVVAFD